MKHAFYLLLILFMASCTTEFDGPKAIELNLKAQKLVEADNTFGLEVFQRLNETEEDNFMISPLSISLALAMTYNGAENETKAAMEDALKVSGLTTDEINQSYQTIMNALLETDNKVTLESAQSIWYRQGYNVLEDFKTVNRTYYDADVRELDFSRSDAKDIINGWIEDKTHDKIKDMIDDVNNSYVMFLINAIYFNASWKTKFNKEDTRKINFNVNDNFSVQVDMMQKKDSVNFMVNDLFTAIEMPYGSGNFNMVVLLPLHNKSCNDIANELTPKNWINWMESFSMTDEVDILLPKFKSEYEIKLNDVLKAMGMEIAFTGAADFSGINKTGGLFIDYVQHNTFIDVNEEGTEAAAATVVAMKESAGNSFYANRPFVYAITEKETGTIIFIGKIVKPVYN